MDVIGAVAVLGALALLLGLLGLLVLLARRVRHRGIGNALIGPFDDVWHPTGRHHHVEVQEQQERVVPAPAPGDPPVGGRP